VLADLGQVRRVEGRLILGAAVIDDVLGFLVLVVVTQSAGGDLSTTSLRMGAIVGAFLVGLAFAETRARKELDRRLKPVYWLLVPFFFVVTGTRVDLGVFRDPHTVVVGLLILAVAIAGKVIGCGAACRTLGARPAMIVGVGMVPRGEVGIVIAAAGLANGVIGPSLYGIIVALTVATTMIVPPILKALLGYPASAVGTTV
jgi:Kef-type K+ transport system membrane component KefB